MGRIIPTNYFYYHSPSFGNHSNTTNPSLDLSDCNTVNYKNITIHYKKLNKDLDNSGLPYIYAEFNSPIKLLDALEQLEKSKGSLQYNEIKNKKLEPVIKALNYAPELKRLRVKGINLTGQSTFCVILADPEYVLKLTVNYGKDHFGRPHNPKIDIPIKNRTTIPKVTYNFGKQQYLNFHYYFQKKGEQNGLNRNDLDKMKQKIKDEGMSHFDMSIMQIAKFNGKLYLIDPECAFAPSQNK